MKKIFICLFLTFLRMSVYSISIADFTVQYEKNGRFYNFYDNPAVLFEILEEENDLENLGKQGSKEYKFDSCFFSVLSREFDNGRFSENYILYLEREGLKNPNHYYDVDCFEANKDFKTVRDVAIGDDIDKVLEKYPEAILYKNNGKYKWNISDCYFGKKLSKVKKKSDIGYVLIELKNWQYNRSYELNFNMHYELVFIIKDSKVESILMQCVLDAV